MPPPTRVFLHYLRRLQLLLHLVRDFDADITRNRLHPDMAPLLQQARTAIGFSLRTTCPLAGRDIIRFGGDGGGEPTLEGILAELAATMDYLAAIPDADFQPGRLGDLRIATTAGFADLDLTGWDYYLMYALPNFFFHYTMVYAIARQAGVPVGKADFDGYHAYPPGFSFAV